MKMQKIAFLVVPLALLSTTATTQTFGTVSESGQGTYTHSGNKITYRWEHPTIQGDVYVMTFSIIYPRGIDYMKSVYGQKLHNHGNYSRFIQRDPFQKDLETVADALRELARKNGLNEIRLALSFVQALPYQDGLGSYQKYAVETLLDTAGDCSDTSVLLAGIFAVWGYDSVFLEFPEHLAVGLWTDPIPGGTYWSHRGRRFYLCETTGTGWEIGFGDPQYRKATISEVNR